MNNSFTSDIYLKHKTYFDERLIHLLEQKEETIASFQNQIEVYKADQIRVTELIKQLKFKIKDLEAVNYNLNQKVKEKDEELNKVIKDFEEKIKKQVRSSMMNYSILIKIMPNFTMRTRD